MKSRITLVAETVAGTAPSVGGINWPQLGAAQATAPAALPASTFLILTRGKNGVFTAFTAEGDEQISELLPENIEAVATSPETLAAQVKRWADQVAQPSAAPTL